MRKLTTAFVSLFVASMPAFAIAPGGTVTGTINGEAVALVVFAQQSDYGNAHISLYIIGDDLSERGLGAMGLGAEWLGELTGEFAHAEASMGMHSNPLRLYYADDDAGLSLTLESFMYVGALLEITGRVEGVLTNVDKHGHKNPDPEDALSIDLKFDAVLQ